MPALSKATYSLDGKTIDRVQRLAHRLQISKTEVIRRAVAKLEEKEAPTTEQRVRALRSLQKSMRARGVDFAAWQRTIRAGRR